MKVRKKASEKSMTQAIMQAVMKKAATKAVRDTETLANTTRPAPPIPKTGDLVLQQPTSDWKSPDMYKEL